MTNTTAGDPISFEELKEEFAFLGEWEDQCDYLIDLGFELPKLPEEAKTEQTRVHGCQSNVWLTAEVVGEGPDARVEFLANSDSIFVNGLIVVVRSIFNGLTPEEILEVDAEARFAELGLDRHVTPQRKNGLFGMVERIRGIAGAAV